MAVAGFAVAGLAIIGVAVAGLAIIGVAVAGLAIIGIAVVGVAIIGVAVVRPAVGVRPSGRGRGLARIAGPSAAARRGEQAARPGGALPGEARPELQAAGTRSAASTGR
ncbi:hypothetical protein [Streptomyces sp. SAS_272]|uniref:hypothetical protein n=1 Tax=Streptomyces sp. SAS_272 TaxID=3412747 RepID=UPI00403D46E6